VLRDGPAVLITIGVALRPVQISLGRQVRAVYRNRIMAAPSASIPRRLTLHLGLGCGIAASPKRLTISARTGPTSASSTRRYLPGVVFGALQLVGTIASAFSISQTQSTLEFFIRDRMAKVLTLLAVVGILMLRPQVCRPQSPQITEAGKS